MVDDDDSELEARLPDQDYYRPPPEFVGQANVSDPAIYDRFEDFPEGFEEYAELLEWESRWDEVLDDSNPPFYEWFVDGELNASYNCIDRHLDERKNQTALLWEGEDGEQRNITYQDLYREVNKMAAALEDAGVEEDDVVTLHLPMLPALPITMLACARIGAPHSEVFAGFSAQALADRIDDAGSDVVVTADGYYRRGDLLNHKEKADEACELAEKDVDKVLVWERHEGELHPDAELEEGRDVLVSELLANNERTRVDPVTRDAEDPLFLMYTSGTTGQPKGVKHTTGGYLAWTAWTSQAVLDVKPEDTYFCSADIGWITGHSYIVYGPLALGTTTMMYEGTPDHPDNDRLWEIVEDYEATQLYTAPTAIRAFMKWGKEYPERHDLSSLRLLGTVGEPINPRAWKWYYKHIGNEECPVVDTWWQTETGGMMITTLPGIKDMKPGSAGPPLPANDVRIVDTEGEEVQPGRAGYLTVNKPWPGMLRTLYKNDERFIEEYWEEYSDTDSDDPDDWVYFPEDGAKIDEDGYITVLGRVDDVINVSGHRLGTMEIESAIVGVEGVAEAAVVGGDHELKGEAVYAYVITEDGYEENEELRQQIIDGVEDAIGPIARPEQVIFTPELPKTRSGKIMRRLLEDIANGEELGDTSTLRNPDVVSDIERKVQGD